MGRGLRWRLLISRQDLFFEFLGRFLKFMCHSAQLAGDGREPLAAKQNQNGRENDQNFPGANVAEKGKRRLKYTDHGLKRIME